MGFWVEFWFKFKVFCEFLLKFWAEFEVFCEFSAKFKVADLSAFEVEFSAEFKLFLSFTSSLSLVCDYIGIWQGQGAI